MTTHEPVMPTSLCSESTPSPGVVVPAAVVVASEGNTDTVGVVEPSSSGPTIEPWPGRAWLMLGDCSRVVAVDDATAVDGMLFVLEEAVRAVATLPDNAITATERTANMMRCEFIDDC